MTRRLVMWDIDHTLLRSNGVAGRAWKAAFTACTGAEFRTTPNFGGRTDLDVCLEVFASHGITDCTPERFFAEYLARVEATRHQFGQEGELLPGVRDVVSSLGEDPQVVQTLVTGNLSEVAAFKIAAFGLTGSFDEEVGGYGRDDSVRANLVRRSLARATAKYGEPFRPVVIGDTVHDVTAALAGGAVAVAVATGRTSADDLARAGAHVVLPDLSDVSRAVEVIRG